MANQKELDSTYMGVALLHARLSKAKRANVGACLVTKQGVCLAGFNGMPTGLPNECEHATGLREDGIFGKTNPEVIHAEKNAILKAAREGVSCLGATMYVTLSPCVQCSAMMINAGIARLVYKDTYRDTKGLDLLKQGGIIVETFEGD